MVTSCNNTAGALKSAAIAALPVALAFAGATAARATPTVAEARLQETWRSTITHVATPRDGCFRAAYPSVIWKQVTCHTAPTRPIVPRTTGGNGSRTVGNGNDYSAETATLTTSAVGSFPSVSGVKTEKDGAANVYSLQLNSGFMKTAGCNGSSNGNCLTWEQFVYSSSSTAAFMQYWLINYGNTCPAGGGWNSYQGSCYKNSAAVSVPKLAITQLGNLKISATAVAGGIDTMVMTTATEAYSTTGKDSVVFLATAWDQSEFNVVGDGGGSAAKFNKGSNITVQIALKDGATAAPTCAGHAGTTGETNNLTLGSCTTAGGASPSVTFTEKH